MADQLGCNIDLRTSIDMLCSKRLLRVAALVWLAAVSAHAAGAHAAGAQDAMDHVAPALAPNRAFAGLGPLADQLQTGTSGVWTLRQDGDRLVLANPGSPSAVRYYTTDWQGNLAVGRSVGVLVKATGNDPRSAAGLIFRVTGGDPRWIAFVVTPDGKLQRIVRQPDKLLVTGTFDVPGGHRPEGDVLEINQIGDTAQLLANGRPVSDLAPLQGVAATIPAPVGIIALGTGEFTFDRFAFGTLVTPPKATKGEDDTIPVAKGGNDDKPASASPARPQLSAPAKPTEAADVQSLGPLGKGVRLGPMGTWMRSLDNGRLVYSRDQKGPDLYNNRFIAWPATAAEGRSASVMVEATGNGVDSGGGLVFGLDELGDRFLTFLIGLDGKVALYRFRDKRYEFLEDFNLPPRRGPDPRRVLKVSQKDGQTTLYVDDKLLKAFVSDGSTSLDATGKVGISVLGTGRYAFSDFAFGAATELPRPPAAPPTAQSSNNVQLRYFSSDTFGAALGIMLHEFGHFMINELNLPSTGPEEDVADEFSAMAFINNLRSEPQTILPLSLGYARLWWYMADDRGDKKQPAFYDVHGPDRARFAKFACMLYGASPQNFETLMKDAGIPETARQRCLYDEPRRHRAWDTLLRPYRRRGVSATNPGDIDPATPGRKVEVVYEEPKDPSLNIFAAEIRNSGIFDSIADNITKLYVLPRDTKMIFKDCGRVNCFYRPSDGSVTMCWEMLKYVIEQFQNRDKVQKSTPTATPAANANSSTELEQVLAGRWRSRMTGQGTSEDMLIELGKQGVYEAVVQTQAPGRVPVTMNVQGRWSVTRRGGMAFELTLTPQQWSPQQMCERGNCTPIKLQTSSTKLELVDRNTVRSDQGSATRVQ